MQAKNYDGTYGPIEDFDSQKLEQQLKNPNVSHVEVFTPTPETLNYRKKLLCIKPRYKKIPRK